MPPPSLPPAATSAPAASGTAPTVSNRPVDSPPQQLDVQPRPTSTQQPDPYEVKKTDGSTYFEAPKLFSPNDRTAWRGATTVPVRAAVYEQPATYRQSSAVTRGPVSAEQANRDAIGWSSVAK